MEYNNISQRKNYENGYENGKEDSDINDNDDHQVMEAFNYFDNYKNGKININELRKILASYGDSMTEEEFDNIFKSVNMNVDNNGFIDYFEFIKLLKK